MTGRDVTAAMVDAFGAAWDATPAGAPGDRRRAGILAALNAARGDDGLDPLVERVLDEHDLYRVDFKKPAGPDGNADRIHSAAPGEANVVSSARSNGAGHRLLIDLDVPAALIPSTTPGHSHLYIDTACTRAQLVEVLEALAVAGAVEDGYAAVSAARGHSALRLPGVKKEADDRVVY